MSGHDRASKERSQSEKKVNKQAKTDRGREGTEHARTGCVCWCVWVRGLQERVSLICSSLNRNKPPLTDGSGVGKCFSTVCVCVRQPMLLN